MTVTEIPFYTGYFAVVVATGIVSTATFFYHYLALSDIVIALGSGIYMLL